MVSQSWANIGSVRGKRGWAAGWRERGEARTQADKDLKLLMFGKIDRVPRGYAATREREPVRMESQNQFIPSRSRPKEPVTVIRGRWRGAVGRQMCTCLVAVGPQGGGCQDEVLQSKMSSTDR
jgi:hypothetical protein